MLDAMPDNVLLLVVKFTRPKHTALVPKTSKDLHARTTHAVSRILAAVRVQKFWRWYSLFASTKTIVTMFGCAKMTRTDVWEKGYNNFDVHIRKFKPTIKWTRHLVRRIFFVSHALHPTGRQNVQFVRQFLGGFMIRYYPGHIFEGIGQLEADLIHASVALYERFDGVLAHLAVAQTLSGLPSDLSKGFLDSMFGFVEAFNVWEVVDKQRCLLRVQNALRACMLAMANIPEDEDQHSPLRTELVASFAQLRAKIVFYGGQDALTTFDAATDAAAANEGSAAGV